MTFEFGCVVCGQIVPYHGKIGVTPPAPTHCGKLARRIYSAQNMAVQRGRSDYIEMACRGEEQVPGMTTQEVRETVDNWS